MYAGYFPMGLSLDRIFSEMPDVPFRDHVWPKFLRENADPRLQAGRLMANSAFEAAQAGGVVDTAVGFPKSREEMFEFYEFIRKAAHDSATKEGASSSSPPATCSRTCRSGRPTSMGDPVEMLFLEHQRHDITQAIVSVEDEVGRARGARAPRPLLREHQHRPERGHGRGAQDRPLRRASST